MLFILRNSSAVWEFQRLGSSSGYFLRKPTAVPAKMHETSDFFKQEDCLYPSCIEINLILVYTRLESYFGHLQVLPVSAQPTGSSGEDMGLGEDLRGFELCRFSEPQFPYLQIVIAHFS